MMMERLTMRQAADDDDDDKNEEEKNSQDNGSYFSCGEPRAYSGGSSVPRRGCQRKDNNVTANQKSPEQSINQSKYLI